MPEDEYSTTFLLPPFLSFQIEELCRSRALPFSFSDQSSTAMRGAFFPIERKKERIKLYLLSFSLLAGDTTLVQGEEKASLSPLKRYF